MIFVPYGGFHRYSKHCPLSGTCENCRKIHPTVKMFRLTTVFSYSTGSGADFICMLHYSGGGRIQWNYIHGLFELAIYGGRVDNNFDTRVMSSYLMQMFDDQVIGERARGQLGPFMVPSSCNVRVSERIVSFVVIELFPKWSMNPFNKAIVSLCQLDLYLSISSILVLLDCCLKTPPVCLGLPGCYRDPAGAGQALLLRPTRKHRALV